MSDHKLSNFVSPISRWCLQLSPIERDMVSVQLARLWLAYCWISILCSRNTKGLRPFVCRNVSEVHFARLLFVFSEAMEGKSNDCNESDRKRNP